MKNPIENKKQLMLLNQLKLTTSDVLKMQSKTQTLSNIKSKVPILLIFQMKVQESFYQTKL